MSGPRERNESEETIDVEPMHDAEATINVPPPGAVSREDPTIIEGAPARVQLVAPTPGLNQDAVEAAVRRGLITRAQGSTMLQRSGSESDVLQVMVDNGLIEEGDANALRDEITEDFVPGYRLVGELGRGGMGVVYRAVHRSLNRQVALKVITPELRLSRDHAERFKREAQTLAALNHPNIVQVYDFGEVGDKLFISLELVDGEDLGDYVDRKERLEWREATEVVLDAARGLGHAFASEAKVIHRDVKPGNLLRATVAGSNVPVTKVTDLGLARMRGDTADGRTTKAGTIMGSPSYMSPEQAAGDPVDHRADIYSLGATYYHFLTGRPPFTGQLIKVLQQRLSGEQVPSPGDLVEGVPDPVLRVIDCMLAQEAEHRYQTYDALIADLEAVLGARPTACPTVPRDASSLHFQAGGPPARAVVVEEASGGRGGLLVLGVVLVVGLVAAGVLLRPDRGSPGPGVGATGSGSVTQPADPYAALRGDVEALLETLAGVDPAARLELAQSAADTRARIDKLPEDERAVYETRLQVLCKETLSGALAAAEALHQDADYQGLKTRCQSALEFAEAAGLPPGERLELLRRFAAAGCQTGSEERARLQEIEAAAASSAYQDVLSLSADFAERFDFSPDVERVADLRRTAEGALLAVELSSTVEGASLFLDGEERSLPYRALANRGATLTATVTAPERLTLRRALLVDAALKLALDPSPPPANLRSLGAEFPLLGSQGDTLATGQLRDRGWNLRGEWSVTQEPDPDDANKQVQWLAASPTARARTSASVSFAELESNVLRGLKFSAKKAEGYHVAVDLSLPEGLGFEIRGLSDGAGRAVGVRVQGTRVELGVYRPGLERFDVRGTFDLSQAPYILQLGWDGTRACAYARRDGMAQVTPLLTLEPGWTPTPLLESGVEFHVLGQPRPGARVGLKDTRLELLRR
ncbi:MAG: serine/threonine-protein kinase [Planctomycetota bacterium]